VASPFLFYAVARYYIKPTALPIALGLFVISEWLVYYSSEVKQYSSDVTIALLLLLVTSYVQRKGFTSGRLGVLGATGAVSLWFSHPAMFVLAGVGVGLGLPSLVRREWGKVGLLSAVGLLWLASFLASYFIALRDIDSEFFVIGWAGDLLPFPPSSFSDVWWLVQKFFEMFANPASQTLTGVAALAFLVGCFSMFWESREKFLVLLFPMLFVLLASALDLYPFGGRLILFLVPSLLLLIGEGAGYIRDKTRNSSPIIGLAVIGLLFVHPVHTAAYFQFHPAPFSQEIKSALSYIREHKQSRDILYIHWEAQYAFAYYRDRYGFGDDYVIGIRSPENLGAYIADLDQLRDLDRVWMIFTPSFSERDFFLGYLDSIGTRVDSFSAPGATVYLYNLTPVVTPAPIAFNSDRDGNFEIYVREADGSSQTNLTNNPAWDALPAWSPDGGKIAFTSARDANLEIYVMNADGSNQTSLTYSTGDDSFPHWSPDGSKIVFTSSRDGDEEIYVMNADGSSQANVSQNPASDKTPIWSPNGSKIAFASDRGGNFEVYLMDADGSSQTNLTNSSAWDFSPAWSPDGSKIAFASDRDGNEEVYVMNADGSEPRRLTYNPTFDGWPAWSPDGSKIAFTSYRDSPEIYVMGADGSNQTRLTRNSAWDEYPVWSPRGGTDEGSPLRR